MKLLNAPIKHIAVENPIPHKVFDMPKETQIIQPYEFGHPVQKATCLWLKDLPQLKNNCFIIIFSKIICNDKFMKEMIDYHRV